MAEKLTIEKQLLERYDFLKEGDFYPEKHSGQMLIKHNACERIASHEGIKYSEPRFLKVDRDHSVLYCAGTLGEKMEWTIGEADLKSNCFNKYVHSMAEKRCKGRLILKLIGVYGDIYTSEETFVDDFERPTRNAKMASNKQKSLLSKLYDETGEVQMSDEDWENLTMQDASKLIDLLNEQKANQKGE
tara:strand:- start:992 stop:1555 length:564 start_codon:yes stop_codon:yes gene_type:complete